MVNVLQYFPLISAFLYETNGRKNQMKACIQLSPLISSSYWNKSVSCASNLIAFSAWWVQEDQLPLRTPGSTEIEAIKGSSVQGKFSSIFFLTSPRSKKKNSVGCNVLADGATVLLTLPDWEQQYRNTKRNTFNEGCKETLYLRCDTIHDIGLTL